MILGGLINTGSAQGLQDEGLPVLHSTYDDDAPLGRRSTDPGHRWTADGRPFNWESPITSMWVTPHGVPAGAIKAGEKRFPVAFGGPNTGLDPFVVPRVRVKKRGRPRKGGDARLSRPRLKVTSTKPAQNPSGPSLLVRSGSRKKKDSGAVIPTLSEPTGGGADESTHSDSPSSGSSRSKRTPRSSSADPEDEPYEKDGKVFFRGQPLRLNTYRGVVRTSSKKGRLWRARIEVRGHRRFLGSFYTRKCQ